MAALPLSHHLLFFLQEELKMILCDLAKDETIIGRNKK
jgi:hypothetical protein